MNKKSRTHILFLLIGFFFIYVFDLGAQTYGLKFKGIDNSLDNRTELDLTPNGYLTFQNEFEISFDYKTTRLYPNSNVGLFGYILRVINKENSNVDLLSSISGTLGSPKLNLVIGDKDSIVQAEYSEKNINNWISLKIKFNLLKDQVIFYTPDTFFVQEKIGFKRKDDFKITFGANDFEQFKTSDVPTMSIRDIKITEQGNLKFHWLLDEKENNIAIERLSKKEASVKNPIWLNLNHQIWQSKFQNEAKGQLMITADTENGRIFVVGSNQLEIYSVNDNISKIVSYKNKPLFLKTEFRPIYNSLDNKIYCYLIGNGLAHVLDVNTGVWKRINNALMSKISTNNRYFNRHYRNLDNSIYMFGGYAQHKYNNEIWKINIDKGTLTELPTDHFIFHPKYLAGLGALNDTIYILGGYGSNSGNQLINPQSYYDLFGYSIKDNSLFKKFEISHIIDDMCVANSMWIDEETRDYYALVFEKSIFDGKLQLVKGNLDSPNINLAGSKIPYKFLDVRSDAGLFYMKQQNKLFAYTTYTTDSLTTQARIYSINYPPNKYIKQSKNVKESTNFSTIFFTVAGIILVGLGFMYFRKRKEDSSRNTFDKSKLELKDGAALKLEETVLPKINYQLIFFGGFQVIDKKSDDITSHFTPLLKELFLLIWLHTYKNDKGISTEKITEVLWYDKTDKSAQNNRAVNMAKLRALLSELGSFKVSKETGYWKCFLDEKEIRSDYVDFLNLSSSKSNLTKQKINKLIEITKKGPFLRNVQYEWLDEFKARVSDITIDTLVYFANLCNIKKEADFIIHLADSIFIFDVTNEDAMILKCRAQYIMGKHSHAKATYKKFSKEYKEMYGENYEQSFVSILKFNLIN